MPQNTIIEERVYESTYLITPELNEGLYDEIIKRFNKLIEDNGGKFINQEIWGYRKLAYPINKRETAYYVFQEFTAPSDMVHVLEREFNYDERIIRYLTVKLDKHMLAWNEKRRSKLKNAGSSED